MASRVRDRGVRKRRFLFLRDCHMIGVGWCKQDDGQVEIDDMVYLHRA